LIGVKRAGRLAFERLVDGGRVALLRDQNGRVALLRDRNGRAGACPSLFFIADDYLTTGALAALSYAGLKVPEDVRLATWANAGLGPDYARPLSLMELDPYKAGEAVAKAMLAYLKNGAFPPNVVVGPKWMKGETMGENLNDVQKETTKGNKK